MPRKKLAGEVGRQTYRFPKKLSDDLKAEAVKRKTTPSVLVRWVLEQWILRIQKGAVHE